MDGERSFSFPTPTIVPCVWGNGGGGCCGGLLAKHVHQLKYIYMFNRSKSSSCRVVVVGPVVVVLVSPQVVWFCSEGWNRNNIKTHVISLSSAHHECVQY